MTRRIFKSLIFLFCFSAVALYAQENRRAIKEIQQWERMAQIFERNDKQEQASEFYIKICHSDPDNRSAYEGAKRTLLYTEQYEKLETLIHFLEQKNEKLLYKVDLASLEYYCGEQNAALGLWQRILKQHSNRQEAFILVGRALIEHHLYDNALKVYESGRKAFENPSLFMFNIATIYKIQEKYKELTLEYLQYIHQHPQQINYLRSDLARSANLPDEQRIIIKVLENQKQTWIIHLWCSDFYTMRGDYEKAFLHLAQFEEKAQNIDNVQYLNHYEPGYEMYSLGETALNDGEYEQAIKIFKHIINGIKGPFVTRSKMSLANAYSRINQYDLAIEMLRKYAKDSPGSDQAVQAMMNLGNISFNQLFDIDMAIEAYQYVVQYSQNEDLSTTARYRLGDCAIAAGDLKLAETYFKSIQSREKDVKILYKLAELAFLQQEIDTLSDYVQRLLKSDFAKEPSLANDILELQMLLQNSAQDSSSLAVLGGASLLYRQQKYTMCTDTLLTFLNQYRGTPLRDELLLLLADAFINLGEKQHALKHLNAVYENKTGVYSDRALFRMAEIYSNQENKERAKELYEKILLEYPNSIYIDQVRQRLRQREVSS